MNRKGGSASTVFKRQLHSRMHASLSDFNLNHHYAFPFLSMTALNKVFDQPGLLKFCVETLSGTGPLRNVTILKKAYIIVRNLSSKP